MDNLKVLTTLDIKLDNKVWGYCLDDDCSTLYTLTGGCRFFKANIDSNLNNYKLLDPDLDPNIIAGLESGDDELLLIEYLVESGSLLLALKSGLLIRVAVTTHSPSSGIVYSHSSKFSSVKISPDHDLLVLSDVQHKLVMLSMNDEFDVLYETNALDTSDSIHKPVGVGWGSKETQFFGLDGRPSKEDRTEQPMHLGEERVQEIEKITSSSIFSKFRLLKNRETVLDWRGDGHYLASMTYLHESDKHYLKVWNRNLQLQYMSEQLVALERGIISWIPNGQYVCCAQRREETINEVVMFEKNGLVHQRFTLPRMLDNLYIREILWSPDSKILAIIAAQFFISEENTVHSRSLLFLYTIQNFHYYLKFSVRLQQDCDYSIRWESSPHSRLHIMSSKGSYRRYEIFHQVNYTDTYSTVAVVDGDRLRLTPMALCNIPPPMSAVLIEFDQPICRIFMDRTRLQHLLVLTLDESLWIWTCSPLVAQSHSSEKNIQNQLATILLENPPARPLWIMLGNQKRTKISRVDTYQQILSLSRSELIAVRTENNASKVTKLSLQDSSMSNELVETDLVELPDKTVVEVLPKLTDSELKSLTLILNDGQVYVLNLSDSTMTSKFKIHTTTPDYGYLSANLIIQDLDDAVISLGQDFCLRFNQHILISHNCTSFRITETYLIYTLADSSMQFILIEHLNQATDFRSIESWSQPIENGSVIVIVSENESKVVLQMPRGNLEVLHPRVLVLLSIERLLDRKNLVEAVKLARRHRLNLNFIYDYLALTGPTETEPLNKLVKDLSDYDPTLLTLFVTELNKQDTITGQYSSIIKHLPKTKDSLVPPPEGEFEFKIQGIYQSIKKLIKREGKATADKLLQPHLLCLLKHQEEGPGEALQIIIDLDEKLQGEAMKFILYFIDIDKLFIEALRTYDTKIALMVAGLSNKDPKEYLVHLNRFDKIKVHELRCYEIDMHISNYGSALRHLFSYHIQNPQDEEIKTKLLFLLDSKRMYKVGVELIGQILEPGSFKELAATIWSRYGSYLLEKRYHPEAGLAFSKALELSPNYEVYNNGLKCFALSNEWEKSMALTAKAQRYGLSVDGELGKLADGLLERDLCLEYVLALAVKSETIPQDASLLCKLCDRRQWFLGEVVSKLEGEERVYIEASASICAKELVHQFTLDLEEADSHYERLKELLKTYQARKLEHQIREESYFINDALSSDASDVSSLDSSQIGDKSSRQTRSLKTRKSSTSSKSQSGRKKRINLNRGTQYEDMALVFELKKFITSQRINQACASQVISAMFEYSQDLFETQTMQNNLKDILEKSLELSREIYENLWPAVEVDNQYSLYSRYSKSLTLEQLDDYDFQVLTRPEIPLNIRFFDL